MTLRHAHDLAGRTAPNQMAARAHAVLDAAFDAGIRFIDVARSYGRGEEFLAAWLAARKLSANDVVVGSKWGYTYAADWRAVADVHEVKDHSLETLNRQLRETREILGPHLSLYQIHSVTSESTVLDDKRVLDRLAELRTDRLRIGLTVSGPQQAAVIRRALDVRRDGQRLFDSVQATWNILERGAEAALADAHADGVRVIIKEILANGRLTEANHGAEFAMSLERVRRVAHRMTVAAEAIALAAGLARPWADVVLTGAATVEQLRSSIASSAIPWSDAIEEELEHAAVPSLSYWRSRSGFAWS